MDRDAILAEMRQFKDSQGRIPSLREWSKTYKHSTSRPMEAGGWATLVQEVQGFSVDELPSELPPIDILLRQRQEQFDVKRAAHNARKLITIRIGVGGPIGICHIGDPHIDDSGTDIGLLERHTGIIQQTTGMFAANVGDTTNNWCGRLAALNEQQHTTRREAWALAEWLIRRCRWLYLISGNHDAWSGESDPLEWISMQAGTLYEKASVRARLVFPNGREVTINCRHDFKGSSQWNNAHGAMKAAQMGFRDNILTNGHKHISGYGIVKDPTTGRLSHCIQVATYKTLDDYAVERCLPDQNISPCVTTIINPYAADEVGLVHTVFDVEEAADFLTWKRERFQNITTKVVLPKTWGLMRHDRKSKTNSRTVPRLHKKRVGARRTVARLRRPRSYPDVRNMGTRVGRWAIHKATGILERFASGRVWRVPNGGGRITVRSTVSRYPVRPATTYRGVGVPRPLDGPGLAYVDGRGAFLPIVRPLGSVRVSGGTAVLDAVS